MRFKDRTDAGKQLVFVLQKNLKIRKKNNYIVISLLRGGIIIGNEISKSLGIKHFPLIVAKIPSPYNPELAIGALCFSKRWLDQQMIKQMGLTNKQLRSAISIAQQKFDNYVNQFSLLEENYRFLKNKNIILTDDGVATGATIKAAFLFIKSLRPKKIVLAVPVALTDFSASEFNQVIILHTSASFSAVSRFYENFSQVSNEKVALLIHLSLL
ncbi:hypothetical protein AUK04_04235 [Candidatus Roizmanbacteria bacterium CG2_30_33_16]|nr:hypothetical protein [Candidatus Roizmanbacteria bacterium]OIP82738.1 MAG: hypothetical protein AUK04_04235 [Candidatus Roizmanbacteria bacterium CG2_30_33_16]